MNFLEMNGLQTAQTHFKDIFRDNIHRDYADAMLDWHTLAACLPIA